MTTVPVSIRPRSQLTPAQELIWTSQRLAPDAPLANMAVLSRFGAAIDPARFIAAFSQVVSASDALRTVIRAVDGVPVVTVLDDPPRPTEVLAVEIGDLEGWMADRIAAPLDTSACGYDSVLLDHGQGDWSWWCDLHHLITDAASSALVFQATAAAYFDETVELPAYRDLVEHLEKRRSDRWRRAKQYWDVEASAPMEETTLYQPDAGPATDSERIFVEMDQARQTGLDQLLGGRFRSLSSDLSLLTTLAAVTGVYLHRLNGTTEITIGMPVHHRGTRLAKRTIGPLVELFPLRFAIDGNDSFADVHQRVAQAVLSVLKRALPGTSPRQTFDVVLNVHAATFGSFGDIHAHSTWFPPGHIDAHHRLRVQALDYTGDGRLDIALDLNHRSAGPAHRARAGGHFAAVLDALVADPDGSISGFELVGPEERAAIVDRYNRLPGSPEAADLAPATLTLPAQIEEALTGNPQSRVVSDRHGNQHGAEGPTHLTARELDDQIGKLATWLNSRGIGRGDIVGIEMATTVDAVVAVHGVLRSGAAFVPIDPSYPEHRRSFLRQDSGACLVLDALPDLARQPVERSPAHEPEMDDLAYVIYTSGSTGQPKGVPITHRGLAEYLAFAVDAYADHPEPVVPLFTSLSFDLTITSLMLPLLAGGRLTVHPDGGPAALRQIAEDREATILKATPSHLELLVRMIEAGHPLRTLIVGGEAFHRSLATRLDDALDGRARILNEYGPTEAVVGCMIHQFRPLDDTAEDVPIGGPAPDVELYVLDDHDRLTPAGCAGELYIGRTGMATSYLDRPDLSGRHFRTVPSVSRNVLYRTGDRVRMRDDDTMVFLGRIDDQVKVRGIRLEPAEIEQALSSHHDVGRAVVRLWSPEPARTVAHCVRCGLSSEVPDVSFDDAGLCSTCVQFDAVAAQAQTWFRTPDDLRRELDSARRRSTGDYDVLHLLSGGKDSTYALYQLVEMGARVLAVTLDNGFISEGAKSNVRRAAADLGVDHEFVTSDAMNEIFRDSLERFSNVCNGCYKAIYTLALNRADELGIGAIVTGLSRGQFFETRLVPGMFGADRFDADAIDATVLEARKAYHRTHDAVHQHLDVSRFETDDIFDRVHFIDFYRYVDVELADMYSFLDEQTTWERPTDTGRSTNCLINAAGIYVHRLERGHHNYALPYSWDVKLGHKSRAEALRELDDPMGEREQADITRMLAEVGYEPRKPEMLTAWYESEREVDPSELRAHLADLVPDHGIPTAFVRLETLPLTANGKVDSPALPPPTRFDRRSHRSSRPPQTPTESAVANSWSTILGIDGVGADDDFFDMGGASLDALEMSFQLGEDLGLTIPEALVFRHRTVAGLATAIDLLADDVSDSAPEPDDLPSGLDAGGAPVLSAGEESLLFEWRLDPESSRYGGGTLVVLPDGIDIDKFDAAVRQVVAHQPTLHTTFGPRRVRLDVQQAVSFDSHVSSGETLAELAATLNKQPFDLEHGPLVAVHHLAADRGTDRGRRAVAIRMHHITGDAGSMAVLWAQIDRAYQGDRLPLPPTTYAAHGAWQRQQVTHEARGFWLDRMESAVGELALIGADDPASAANRPDGFVTRTLSVSVDDLRAGPGRSPLAPLLAATAVALTSRHSAPGIELSLATSTRDRPEVRDVVGYFVNLLPIRVDPERRQTLRSLVERIDASVGDAIGRRTVPFAQMVSDARSAGLHGPRGRIVVAYNESAPIVLGAEPAQVTAIDSGGAVGDLAFLITIDENRVRVGLEFAGQIIDPTGAELLLDTVDALTSMVATDPDQAIGPAVDRAEAEQPSVAAGPSLPPDRALLPSRIRRSIARAPEADAVRSGGRSSSYRTLDAESLRLAARLEQAGVSAGDRVAVIVPRSVALPAAIVAIWRLGASYVPIDVSQPAERLALLCESADVRAAVCAQEAPAAGLGTIPIVTIDVDEPPANPASGASDWAELTDLDEAYVIFTSGSTGIPKPVSITHGNLAASVAARSQFYEDPVDRYLLMSSAGFDSSVAGLFWTLADGGTLVIPTEEETHDVDALIGLIEGHAVTHMLCVPSVYGAMLDRRSNPFESIKVVIVAGEACPPSVVVRHYQQGSSGELVNEYGPTEATVWASAHRVTPADANRQTIPIGRPIAGVEIAILDSDYRPVPLGTGGQLAISGPTVSPGYDGMEEETAARFVTLPSGSRAYLTGDRAVIDRHGTVRFLGRVDGQLSVGGLRIEPEEVELALGATAGVRAVAVTTNGRDLIAFVEADDVEIGTLRDMANTRLPLNMRPAEYRIVRHLPRTTNGKIDRSTLIELAPERPPSGGDEERPSPSSSDQPVDEVLRIWRSVFGRTAVAADDDFFAVGGDSLRAVELVLMLEAKLDVSVGIGELFEFRTPRMMAEHLFGRTASTPGDSAAVSRRSGGLVEWMRRAGDLTPLVLLPPGGGNLLRYAPLVQALPDELPVVGLRLPGADADTEVLETIEAQAARLVQELRRAQPDGPYRLLGWSTGGLLAWEMTELLRRQGQVVELLALVDTFQGGAQMAESAKLDKYSTLWHNGGPAAVLDEMRTRVSDRIRAQVFRLRYRASRSRGSAPDLRHAERTLGPVVRRAAMSYRPRPMSPATPTSPLPTALFFAASETDPSVSVEPWTQLHPHFQVVQLEGVHFRPEADCIIGPARVGHLATALRASL